MLLALPLTGLFFGLELFATHGTTYQQAPMVSVDERTSTGSTVSAEPLAVKPAPGKVPVVTATPGAERKVPPTKLMYPRLGIDMPVVPTGVTGDGQMEIPGDAATAGWYKYGMAPADEVGNTVVAAHNGSPTTPVGPLDAISGSRTGDEIRVMDESGAEHSYRVAKVEHLNKHELDFGPYFSRSAAAALVLVTCGGEWVPEENTYSDNVIVIAEPLT